VFSIKLRARPQPNQRLTGAAILLFVGFNVLAGGPGSLALTIDANMVLDTSNKGPFRPHPVNEPVGDQPCPTASRSC
jgi:hypothetical protein